MIDTRKCPVCHGEGCRCCNGVGTIPYPWILPEDDPMQQPWTIDEVEVINSAMDAAEAYRRYCSVYGSYERSRSSVRHRWRRQCGTTYCWTSEEVDTIDTAPDPQEAVRLFRLSVGTCRSDRAIRDKWYRLRK